MDNFLSDRFKLVHNLKQQVTISKCTINSPVPDGKKIQRYKVSYVLFDVNWDQNYNHYCQ